jgi:hypothetical protein
MNTQIKHIEVDSKNHLTATEKKHIKYLFENGYIDMNNGLTSATANNKAYYFYSNDGLIQSSKIIDLTVRIEEKQKAEYYQTDASGNVLKVLKNKFHVASISIFIA